MQCSPTNNEIGIEMKEKTALIHVKILPALTVGHALVAVIRRWRLAREICSGRTFMRNDFQHKSIRLGTRCKPADEKISAKLTSTILI